ncbi:13959_t:CDS:2 [Acaulospora morrowiae]|uniref:13959_t:CDS:1 n=1 Tax=Acaulospora morrowiae TaxID=94023 RepID=A0A9N8ZSD0_9GLOM|nr:13959_t:CDS:2 [Acaulospora morrowiae]
MSTANKTQNVPGPDLPSPRLKMCEDNFLPLITNEDRPAEFAKIRGCSQARSDIKKLYQDYNSLVEIHEQGSVLTREKLEKYIEIADQVIKMNELTLEELNKKHELLKNSRKESIERSGKNLGSREDILEGNIEMESERSEIGENSYDERKFGDEMIGSNEERTKSINENHRGNGVGKKIPNQGDVPENGDKQVSKSRHKVRSNEKGEENYGVGSSKTDYAVEGIKDGAEIIKKNNSMNGKDDKVGYAKENDGLGWSDEVNARFDENEGRNEDDWESEDIDDYKEIPNVKKGGYGGNVKENKNSRNRYNHGRSYARNGNNNRRRNFDNRN